MVVVKGMGMGMGRHNGVPDQIKGKERIKDGKADRLAPRLVIFDWGWIRGLDSFPVGYRMTCS